MLRDQIVFGIIDPTVREKLLFEKDLTFAKACEIVRACEAAKQSKTLSEQDKSSSSQKQEKANPQETPRTQGDRVHTVEKDFSSHNCLLRKDLRKERSGLNPCLSKESASLSSWTREHRVTSCLNNRLFTCLPGYSCNPGHV